MENTKTLDTLFEEHRIAEEKRILDRWDRIWAEYEHYLLRGGRTKGLRSFPDWAKTSKYSLNDKLV